MGLSVLNIVLIAAVVTLFISNCAAVLVLWRYKQRMALARGAAKPFNIDGSTVGAPSPLPYDPEDGAQTAPTARRERWQRPSPQSLLLASPSTMLQPVEHVPRRPLSSTNHVLLYDKLSGTTSPSMLQELTPSEYTHSQSATPLSTPKRSCTSLVPNDLPRLRPLPSVSSGARWVQAPLDGTIGDSDSFTPPTSVADVERWAQTTESLPASNPVEIGLPNLEPNTPRLASATYPLNTLGSNEETKTSRHSYQPKSSLIRPLPILPHHTGETTLDQLPRYTPTH